MRFTFVLVALGVVRAAEEAAALPALTWSDVPDMVGDLYLGAMAAT